MRTLPSTFGLKPVPVRQKFRYNAVLRSILMATPDILELLIAERDKLNQAIHALQGSTVRRARAVASTPTAATNGRRGMSAAARRAQSRRMKALWAKRRKQAAAK